jgi:hypothetical protein
MNHLFGPGISNEAQEPLPQLLTVCLDFFPPLDVITLTELRTLSTSSELHFGHFIADPSFSFFSFKSSKTLPQPRQRNS